MRKKDRTSEEKVLDGIVKTAIMHLGPTPTQKHDEPTPFPYYLAWDRLGRKGQRCRIIPSPTQPRTVQVVFEDGTVTVINRMAIRLL
jgi:hypothetical protein